MTESYLQIAANNEELARDIVERASARGVTVSTAESLTAGMIASTIADIPGASAVLRGGAVTYCDEIKHRVLGHIVEGIDQATAKKIKKDIKDQKLKVKVTIEADKLRVTSASKDALQTVIQFLREQDYGQPLQFTNYR